MTRPLPLLGQLSLYIVSPQHDAPAARLNLTPQRCSICGRDYVIVVARKAAPGNGARAAIVLVPGLGTRSVCPDCHLRGIIVT